MATSVFQHSGETALFNTWGPPSDPRRRAWNAYHNRYPNRSFSHFLRDNNGANGIPKAAPAAGGSDLQGGGGVAPGGAAIAPTNSAPAFDPQQQADYNDKFWSILYGAQDNEADYADAVLNDKMVRDAMDLNFKKSKMQDADEESARGLTATGYAYHHFADLDADFQRDTANQANTFVLATNRYNANIGRFNSALSQLGEEGNVGKFLNVANIAAGTAGTGAVAAGAAPRSIAPAAPANPGAAAAPAPVRAFPPSEGLGDPRFDPKAARPADPKHELLPGYRTSPTPQRENPITYLKKLRAIRDRHGADSQEVRNYRTRSGY